MAYESCALDAVLPRLEGFSILQQNAYRVATRLTAISGIVVNGVIAGATVVTSTPAQSAALPSPQLPTLSISVIAFSGVTLWHGIALALLAIGTVVFIVLFIRMLESGDSPQLESHWGGIGGGLGGWRLSGSLTYLAAATVFGVLFAFFVLHLDSPSDAEAGPGLRRTGPKRPRRDRPERNGLTDPADHSRADQDPRFTGTVHARVAGA